MKKLTNTETDLKKSVDYKKSVYIVHDKAAESDWEEHAEDGKGSFF